MSVERIWVLKSAEGIYWFCKRRGSINILCQKCAIILKYAILTVLLVKRAQVET